MSKHFAWIWFFVGTTVAVAQEPVGGELPPLPPTETSQPLERDPLIDPFLGDVEDEPRFGAQYNAAANNSALTDFESELALLRDEREAVSRTRYETEVAKQNLASDALLFQKILNKLLNNLATGGVSKRSDEKSFALTDDGSDDIGLLPPSTPQPVDYMGLANAEFQQEHYDEALDSFGRALTEPQTAKDGVYIQYMIATCLRKLKKYEEARDAYSEVAVSPDDKILAEYANWQLNLIKWRLDLDERLKEQRHVADKLKQLTEEMDPTQSPPSPPTETAQPGDAP